MNLGKTLFAQIMDFLPWKRFHRIVARRHGDHYVKHYSCAEQFRVMAFAQLSYRESLRDIELCLIDEARGLYAHEPFGIDLAGSVYALDASAIDLCLSLFPRAHFGHAKTRASIKLHTLLDLRGNIPSYIHLSNCQNRAGWPTCVGSTSCQSSPVLSM